MPGIGESEQRAGPGEDAAAGAPELLADLDHPGAWTLVVGGVIQSHVDLDHPRHLELEYMRRLGHLVDLAAPAGEPLRILHLGGGGLSLARYVAATRPGSGQLAVEADPEIAELVRSRLPVAQGGRSRSGTGSMSGRIRVRVADARVVLEHARPGSFDVVVLDAFAGPRTPAHLTSVEFTRAVARALTPAGLYAVNIGDGPPFSHSQGRMAAIRAVFPHACLIAEPAILRARRFGNLVAGASSERLPVGALTRRTASDPYPARVLDDLAVGHFIAGAKPITDATAEASPTPPPEAFA